MCPLRFILVFLSAILAGYVAWRSASSSSSSSSSSSDLFPAAESEKSPLESENRRVEEDGFGLKKMIQRGFWIFVDMASGRFLWRNLNSSALDKDHHDEKVESN